VIHEAAFRLPLDYRVTSRPETALVPGAGGLGDIERALQGEVRGGRVGEDLIGLLELAEAR
jgi:hypothetical protein